MLQQGKAKKEVIKVLGVNKNSLTSWDRRYWENGLNGFKDKPIDKKFWEYRLLSPAQDRYIQKKIIDKMFDQLKSHLLLSTRKAIEREYGIKIVLRTISDYLK